jgi:hypothetical protein
MTFGNHSSTFASVWDVWFGLATSRRPGKICDVMKCDRCGAESARESFFRVVPRSFSKQKLQLCPSCVIQHGDREQIQASWIVLGLGGFAILIAWITPGLTVGPVIANFSLLLVFEFGSTVAHELGHVLLARLVGMHVTGIEIGRGRLVADFSRLGFQWQFRAVPLGGLAFAAPPDGRWVRLRYSAFILGGPLANVLLILVGLALAWSTDSLRYDFMERFNPGVMLMITNAGAFVGSLVPYRLDTSRGRLPSDGLQLWQTWHGSMNEIETLVVWGGEIEPFTPGCYVVHTQDRSIFTASGVSELNQPPASVPIPPVNTKLDEAQQRKVAGWVAEGLALADIQKRLASELGVSLTYMELRFIVDDLKLVPTDAARPKEDKIPTLTAPPRQAEDKAPGTAPAGSSRGAPTEPAPAPAPGAGTAGRGVSVVVDTVARPGALVSGSVRFSDGQAGNWYLDQFGRLGVVPAQQGYKPSAADMTAFQQTLETELSRLGY